jgi:uncharacterized membrane protein HdeD (DUF308 family)
MSHALHQAVCVGDAQEVSMHPSSLFSRLSTEVCLTGARAVLALVLALALVLTPHLFLEGLVGTLGMYAVTDAVFASLARVDAPDARSTRYVRLEGALSFVLGIVVMLAAGTQGVLLVLFCVRNLLVSSSELLLARQLRTGRDWLSWRAPGAYLAYAGLSASALSVGFLIAASFGYGALDLYACIAGQVWIWSSLMVAHAIRLTGRARAPHATRPTIEARRASWV